MTDKWQDSAGYEAYVGRWSRKVAARFLAWLAVPADGTWLELGCGTGALTGQVLARCAPRAVVAVEPSEAFLAAAQQNVTDSRVSFRQGDGAEIPVKDAAADTAISGLVLNFIPDPAAALSELKRCVKPGGWIAAYVWDYAGHVQFMRYFWDAAVAQNPAAAEKDEGRRFPICRPQPLRQLFEGAGLQSVEVVPIDIPTPYANFDDYWTPFLSGVGPAPGYCVALDEATRAELRERLRASLPTDSDGLILLAARAWAVRGRTGG